MPIRELNQQHFCSWCGSKVKYSEKWASKCSGCDFKNYINHKPAVNVIITHKNKILLVKRAIEPGLGKYDLPGGFVDIQDKNIEQTCYREVEEEVGLTRANISVMQYFGTDTEYYNWMSVKLHILCFFFLTKLTTDPSTVKLDLKENQELLWIEPSNISDVDLAWNVDKKMLARYANNRQEK